MHFNFLKCQRELGPTSLFSKKRGARKRARLRASGEMKVGKMGQETTLDFTPTSKNPKYFIEVLKYFTNKDLKLGFSSPRSRAKSRKVLHASARGRWSGKRDLHKTPSAVKNWRNSIFRWNLILFFCLKITGVLFVSPSPEAFALVSIHVRISSLAQIFIQ